MESCGLVQIAHAYLGMEHKSDVLDMRNDFLFTGRAVIRNQCYGMTSCGTGGCWALTTGRKLGLGREYGRISIRWASEGIVWKRKMHNLIRMGSELQAEYA